VAGTGLLRFLAYDIGSAAVWAATWTGLGYALSDVVEDLTRRISRFGEVALAVLAAGLAVSVAVTYAQRRRFIRELRIARIAPEDLARPLAAGERVLIVDLRTALDARTDPCTIPGALRMTPEEIEHRHAQIARDVEIVLFCT
jgi:hypothetical protein